MRLNNNIVYHLSQLNRGRVVCVSQCSTDEAAWRAKIKRHFILQSQQTALPIATVFPALVLNPTYFFFTSKE